MYVASVISVLTEITYIIAQNLASRFSKIALIATSQQFLFAQSGIDPV